MTEDTYRGFEKERIAENPTLQLAWDLCQIVDDDAPLRWHRHIPTAQCLLAGYRMIRTGYTLEEQNIPRDLSAVFVDVKRLRDELNKHAVAGATLISSALRHLDNCADDVEQKLASNARRAEQKGKANG